MAKARASAIVRTGERVSSVARSDFPKVLMLAYEFPPTLSSGCSRPVANARYFREFGLEPVILTVNDIPGWPHDATRLGVVPSDVFINRLRRRSWERAVSSRVRPFSFIERAMGKPEAWLAEGLQWRLRKWMPVLHRTYHSLRQSWRIPAIRAGLEMVDRLSPSAIWATGPPFETLKAACVISEATKLPLIADLRDPWTHGACWRPRGSLDARREREWEGRVFRQSDRIVFTTPMTEQRVRSRFPQLADKCVTITNGFEDIEPVIEEGLPSEKMVLSYVGAINSEYRNPTILFDALKLLREHHPKIGDQILMRIVGPVSGYDIDRCVSESKGMVEYIGPVSYAKSVSYINASDVLLLLQLLEDGSDVIGAKTFQYLHAKKPIIGIVNPNGGDAWLLKQSGVGVVVGMESPSHLMDHIVSCFGEWSKGRLKAVVDDQWLAQFERRSLTARLARLIHELLRTDGDRSALGAGK